VCARSFYFPLALSVFLGVSFTHKSALADSHGKFELSGFIQLETRIFSGSRSFDNQDQSTVSPSLVLEPEFVYEINNGDDRFTVTPFLRGDIHDDNRSHFDIREASWLHSADNWDLQVGLSKVFWGTTESRHLVDIINQTDAVEDPDGEDKLGQPMINGKLFGDFGTVSLFVLPGFRERTFADDNARLRGSLPIEGDSARYQSGAKDKHVDFAARWSDSIGDLDIGLSQFIGTGREPRMVKATSTSGSQVFQPYYDQIDQFGVDGQYTRDAWLWKLEAITRGGQGMRFFASVTGFEYTLFQISDTKADLGLLAEYLYDGRDSNAPATSANDDIFVATRLTLNDPADTTALLGAIIDRRNGETALSFEAERRIGDRWKAGVEARWFIHTRSNSFLNSIRNDDFITFNLSRFF